ncbi:MAG TPA: hypothetical protein PKA60_01750 [Candidatus Paceibacterota bacterium]|nr:hypothetical protein [Candidatus Paceibacterota bacterium]
MNLEIIYAIFWFVAIISLFSVIFLSLLYLPLFIRGTLIKLIARKYGLSFQRNIKLKLYTSKNDKIHLCNGLISDVKIEFFDFICYESGIDMSLIPQKMRKPGSENDARTSFKRTRFIIDGKEYFVKNMFFSGYANLFRINRILGDIKSGKINESFFDDVDSASKRFNIMFVLVILVTILIAYFYIAKNFY